MKLSEDAPVVSIAEQISEVIIAGFLWLIACIPIITIGPASAALYYTIVKVVRKKHSTVTIAFWHSFKENLKQGIGITLFYLVYAVILLFYVSVVTKSGMFERTPYLFCCIGNGTCISVCSYSTVYFFRTLKISYEHCWAVSVCITYVRKIFSNYNITDSAFGSSRNDLLFVSVFNGNCSWSICLGFFIFSGKSLTKIYETGKENRRRCLVL